MHSRHLFIGCVTALLIATLFLPTADGAKGGNGKPPKDGGDTTPPDAIDDLSAAPGGVGGVLLTFTRVGDDGGGSTCSGAGRASFYDIRYSTSSIDNYADFDAATQVSDLPTPNLSCGNVPTVGACGLSVGTTYYFAIEVVDEAGNASGLSNLASSLPGNALGNYVHIDDVHISWWHNGGPKRLRRAYVTIRDENGVPVTGATVWGLWTGAHPTNNPTYVVTDCRGRVVFEGGSVLCKNYVDLEFTVTDVIHPTAQYDPLADVGTVAVSGCL